MTRWLDGLEEAATTRLPESVARYFRQGSRDGISAVEAVQAWRDIRVRPRVLRDVSSVGTAASLLGSRVDAPIAVAPTTLQRHADPAGECAMAAGVAAAGSLVCVSSNAGFRFDEIAAEGAPWWVQTYVMQDLGLTEDMLRRAVAAGAGAVVVTVDTPIVGTKYDDGPPVWEETPEDYLHANVAPDLVAASATGFEKLAGITPDVISWLSGVAGLPVVVKGVLRGDDARAAVDAGAAAVWVSNHGGRQLDQAVSTMRALPEVAAAVGEAAEVYVDGGIRRGMDVFAACALGATTVFVGRPALWALAAEGSAGVTRLLRELQGELVEAMTLAGCPALDDVSADLIAVPATTIVGPASP